MKKKNRLPRNAVHPGEILRELFMSPFSLTVYRLAEDLKVTLRGVNELIPERRPISADMALRLAR